ncbi:hypothetical protein HYC85_020100 [Camellia sinensis]|uniref:Exocyst complex component SEC5 n=1 Tax=Camellia sinensis TaxID=4442 RepID=A0A7J7GSR0_CAMSI|nr:hypothetical protein HYC85_020100 [Camellia sinensis]
MAMVSLSTVPKFVLSRMIQSLRSEATKSEDTFVQLQEIQESVRLAFLNCLLDFAGHLEHIGSDLSQNSSNKDSPHSQNGYSHELQENLSDPLPGSVIDPHQQVLMVLSNIGYCKDELSRELYYKYRHVWSQSRTNEVQQLNVQLALLQRMYKDARAEISMLKAENKEPKWKATVMFRFGGPTYAAVEEQGVVIVPSGVGNTEATPSRAAQDGGKKKRPAAE